MTDKKALRKQLIEARLAIEPDDRDRRSRAAQANLIASDWFARAGMVLIYEPIRAEVGTGLIAAAALAAGKQLALPRVQREPRRLWLHAYSGDPDTLAVGAYGIREPDPAWPLVGFSEVDLVAVPGVAFDRSGARLGYGGGYYDRTLPQLRAANPGVRLVGLAYGIQLLETVPRDSHDIPLDGVATEDGFYKSG